MADAKRRRLARFALLAAAVAIVLVRPRVCCVAGGAPPRCSN